MHHDEDTAVRIPRRARVSIGPVGRRLTRKPWFGPRPGRGWGLTPVSWEGFVVLVVFAGLVTAAHMTCPENVALMVDVVLILALLGIAITTGDPPG